MASNTVLMQAASGLVKLMSGGENSAGLKDSTVAQVSAALYYQANVLAELETSRAFQNQFRKTIFSQLEKDFGLYIDAKARTSPSSLHHVYEWNRAGDPAARLFKLTQKDITGLSFRVGTEFKNSRTAVPSNIGRTRHVFINKAAVMEEGKPLVIKPKNAERLVFEIRGSVVYMPKGQSVTIRSAGGGKTTSRYSIAYAQFFRGNLVKESIKKSGFQKLFGSSMAKAMRLPADIKTVKYSFSANTINMQSKVALEAAFGVLNDG